MARYIWLIKYFQFMLLQPIFYNQMNLLFREFLIIVLLYFANSQPTYPEFKQYVIVYGKNYTEKEYQERKKIYQSNILIIDSITDYTPGINNLTDWTQQQVKSRNNLLQLPQKQKVSRSSPVRDLNIKVGNPVKLDWRQKGAVTSVKDQSKCGACWAFAAVAVAQSFLIIQNRFNSSIDLSQQFVLKCTMFSSCQGGYLQFAISSALNLAIQISYPYAPYDQQRGLCLTDEIINVGKYSQSYYNLDDQSIINFLQYSPLAIAISSKNWQYYASGVFSCPTQSGVDHAVLLVGYTSEYWIVKNQWGRGWGLNGFIHITRNRTANCNIGKSVHRIKGNGNTTNDLKIKSIIHNNTIPEANITNNGSSFNGNNTANISIETGGLKNNYQFHGKCIINLISILILAVFAWF